MIINSDLILRLSKDKYDKIAGKRKLQKNIAEIKAEVRVVNDEIKTLDAEIENLVYEAYKNEHG